MLKSSFVLILALISLVSVAADVPVRERLSFNADWRFTKDDPADAADKLKYTAIKDWVTASGNEFTTNTAKTLPPGNPGGDISYAQNTFDDHQWRALNLPHDWGIEGPF